MENLRVNGISMAYERRGRGAPLLFVHGFPLSHVIWEPVMPYLETHFDMIVPDLRGFGASYAPDGPYSIVQMADDLSALLDALGIEKTYLAAHSMGGFVANAFAQSCPECVLGLAMVGSQPGLDAPERIAQRYATAKQIAETGVSVLVEQMAARLSANPGHLDFLTELILSQHPNEMIGAMIAMAERADYLSRFGTYQFPVVLVRGTEDKFVTEERFQAMREALPHSMVVELPGVGHLPSIEAPVETAEALKHLL